jgi:hypothetical protein
VIHPAANKAKKQRQIKPCGFNLPLFEALRGKGEFCVRAKKTRPLFFRWNAFMPLLMGARNAP